MTFENKTLTIGALLMFLGAVSFVLYAIVFLLRDGYGLGFELGVETIDGATRVDLADTAPALLAYISHLHFAVAGFIAATGIASAALSWYGVRQGLCWAWVTAVLAPVIGLGVALPLHYTGGFAYNWLSHLGPIYLGTAVYVVGAVIALAALVKRPGATPPA